MAQPFSICEGDTVLLKCSETEDYVFSVAISPSEGKVRLHPNPKQYQTQSDEPSDQIFRNVHFAAFQILSEPWHTFISSLSSPIMLPKEEPFIGDRRDIFTHALYGRKIKLRHVASNMFLSVDNNSDNLILVKKKDVRKRDAKNGIITINDPCDFKILPTHTRQAKGDISILKKRGDTVCPGDEVILESMTRKGYHILSCKSDDPQKNDLKIAVANSSFVIEVHTNTSSFKSSEAIRGGSVIRFRNIKVDGFLTGKAADTVTVRKKWSLHGMKRLPPVSGDCWWQLENVDSEHFDGGPIHFKEKYYIKHVPTQKYLKVQISEQSISLEPSTVERKYKLILEKSCGSMFVMISRNEGNDSEVLRGSLMKLQWFTNDIDSGNGDSKPDLFLSTQGDHILPKVVSKKRQIGQKLFNLSLKEKETADNFRIEEVTPNHVHNLYFVASISNVLQEYNKSIQRDSSYKSDELNKILDELVKWIDKDITTSSKMLRIYHVVDILIEIFENTQELKLQEKICTVLEHYARTPNDKSRKYLSQDRFLELFLKRLCKGDDIHVKNVLCTLIHHDSEIANSVLKIKKEIPDFDRKLTPAVLELYSALCFTADLPNRELQDQVFNTIIKRRQESFYATEVKGDEVYFVSQGDQGLEGPSQGVVQGRLSVICQTDDVKQSFIAQLKLFSRVCKGVNMTSINEIKKYRGNDWPIFNEALIVLKDSKVPPDVKSAYLDLVESVYIEPSIDRNGRCIDDLWHCYLWENLTNTDPLKASNVSRYSVDSLEDATNIHELISIIGNKVENTQVLDPEKNDDNELLAQMLEVMERLTAYAYCWDVSENTKFELSSLVRILRGSKKENNEHDFKVKIIAVKLLHGFLKQFLYVACAKLMVEFRHCIDGTRPGLNPLLNMSFNIENLGTEVLRRHCQTLAGFVRARGDYKCFNVDDSGGLVVILQDLMSYDNDELRICSANLLYAIYKKEHQLFEDAKCSYIHTAVNQKDETEHHSIYNWSLNEGSLRGGKQKSKDDPTSDVSVAEDSRKLELKDLVDANYPTELPNFILKLKTSPFLFVQNEVCPRPSYQKIVYTTGVYSALLIFVFKHFSKDYKDHPEKDKIKKVLVDVFDVLQKICRGNKMIQQKMFLHFTDFYEVKIAISSVSYLLTEIITDHVELCRNFSEGDIRQLYILACNGTSNETKEYLDFFTTLEAVMKPSKCKSGPPLMNSQENIARMLNESFQYKDNFFSLMLEDKANERLAVLSKDTPNDDVELLTLLNVSSLLATCAEGRGRFAEVVCHKIFTVEELMNILVNNDVPRQRKVPFARLLNEGCIYSEKFSCSSLHELKNKDSDFWKHIDACTFFVNRHIDTFGDEKFMFLFKRLFSEHISWTNVWKLDDESSTEEISFGLFYLVDGVIPLITSLCNELNSDELDELQQYKLKEFGDAVLKLHNEDLAPIFLTCKAHTEFWKSCFNSIAKVVPSEQYKTATAKIGQQYFKFEELVKYEAEVAEENGLNSLFHNFISNYQKVYEQGSDNGNQDTDDTDLCECCTQLLPGGRSFRQLIELFCNDDSPERSVEITKPLSDMLEVFNNQLHVCQAYDSYKRNQLNEVLLFTLQTLFGVLDRRMKSVKPINSKEIENDLEKMYEKAVLHLVHPDDDVAVTVLGLIYVLLYKCDYNMQKKIAAWISHGDANLFIRLHKLLTTAISCFSYYRSVQDVASITSDPHVEYRDQLQQQQDDNNNKPQTSTVYSIESAGQLEVTEEEAVKHVNVVLNVIITMCDRQVKEMQDILQSQEHYISISIVGEVSELLQTLAEHENPDMHVSIIVKAIQALIEMCGGNHKNQTVAINSQVIDSLNLILLKGLNMMNWEHVHMQCKALELLEILLEETCSDQNACQRIGRTIAKDLKREIVEKTMYKLREEERFDDVSDHKKEVDIATVKAYHIMKKVADYLDISVGKYAPHDVNDKVWQYVEEKTCHIEVNYTNSNDDTVGDDTILTSVYFHFDSSGKLTENEKNELQLNINRDSLEDKAKDLLIWAESVHKNLKYKNDLKYRKLIEIMSTPLHYSLCFMTILLNILVLSIFRISDNSITIGSTNSSLFIVLFPYPILSYEIVYRQLAIFHVVLSQLMVFEYFYTMHQNFFYKIPFVLNKRNEIKEWFSKIKRLRDKFEYLKKKNEKLIGKKGFEIYFFGLYTLYRLFFLACSILGLLLSGYFYCFCLPYIFIKVNVLEHIVKAIRGRIIQLSWVGLLILSIILIYATISFAFISNFFNPEPGSNLFCHTLFECYITVMREGLLGGFKNIPVNHAGQVQPSFQTYLGRLSIDLSFYVIVSVIGLGVISAILIVRFNQLRTESDKAEKDKKDYCFVCGIESDRFERRGKSFEDHYHDDHNMYNYMYFIHHVMSKEPKDHNAVEKYVYDCFEKKDYKFLPLRKARALGGKVSTKYEEDFVKLERKQYDLFTKLVKNQQEMKKSQQEILEKVESV